MRRMNMEFTEMLQTTTGKLLDQITVRDFNLGRQFPVIKNICIQNVSLKEETTMEELSLLLDLVYKGGFQLAVDVDMVFGKSAYLSVKVTKIQGRGRLQYTRVPFTHWSFSFIEDPVMEFEVESHFEGRPVPQITSLIVNQIRRSIRKKHTLPNYKIRYKPFVVKPEPTPTPPDIYYQGSKLSLGHLSITVLECNRLVKVVGGAYVYATLALDTVPWLELMSSRRKLWVAHDIEIMKTQGQNIGISFKDDYILDRYEEMVVVDVVTPYTPAAFANIKKNDVVVAVGGVKVTNTKQAAKLMKQATDKLVLRIERPSALKGMRESSSSPDFKFEEDTVSIKDPELPEDPEPNKDESDDYINITLTSQGGNTPVVVDDKVVTKEMNGLEGSLEDITLPGSSSSPSKKAFSILSSSTGLFHRKKNKMEPVTKPISKSGSPEPKPKPQGQGSDEGQEAKVKVAAASMSSPDLLSKKFKEVPVPASVIVKEKTKDLNDRPEPAPSADSLECMNDCGTAEEQLGEYNSVDLKKTQFLPAAEDLAFNERFEFDIEESHNFLNVCVWCKIPEKLDKQSRVVKPEKDILLGHVSIPLMDIALECLATLQGDLQMTYKLTPAEMKAGASRNKVSSLSAHPGFDEKLCYGDITLEFSHSHAAGPFTRLDRDNITKMTHDSVINASVNGNKGPAKMQQSIKRQPPEEGKHDFVGTHFQSATYCNFCHKKIWLKTAFQCQVCGMVCHKKCTERCQAQTICSKKGFQIKEPPSTVFRKSTKEGKEGKEEVKEAFVKDTSGGHRASFLSKFRKERGGSDQGSKALTADGSPAAKGSRRPSSPEPMSVSQAKERKRHNSAPDEEHLLEGAEGTQVHTENDGLLSVSGIPRPRSSTSLGDLIKSKVSPSLRRKKKAARESSPEESASNDEDDMNMLKVYEQQKAAHNADELVVTAAKEMGKELYAHLDFEQRKEKLDSMIVKLQDEIDQESENRAEMSRLEREVSETHQKMSCRTKIEKSDEKIQSLALLMLHYCAGLQHCLEEQELERQRRQMGADMDEGRVMEGGGAMEGGGVMEGMMGGVAEGSGVIDDDSGGISRFEAASGQEVRDGYDGVGGARGKIGLYLNEPDGISADDDGAAADDESSNEDSECDGGKPILKVVRRRNDSDQLTDPDTDASHVDMMEQPNVGRVERFMSLTEETEDFGKVAKDTETKDPITMSFRALLSQQDSDSDLETRDNDQNIVTDSDHDQEDNRDVLTPHSFVSCDSDQEATGQDPEYSGKVSMDGTGDTTLLQSEGGITVTISGEEKPSQP